MTKSKKMIIGTLPFVALIVLFAIFCGIVSSKGYRLDMYIKIVFNEGIVLSIVATGAIFIYTLGSFDISLGAATLFAATLGVMTYNATENIGWMILVIMLAGIGCSLLNSVLASIFHIPVFVTNGNVIRDAEGNAVSISQNYQVATDEATFDEFFKTDNGDNPIYNKETLDTIIGDSVTCDDITKLVESK